MTFPLTSLAIGVNNVSAIVRALRLGLPVSRAVNALNEAQSNGPTLFWVIVNFHKLDKSLARQIVDKHTSTTGTDWRTAIAELEFHIVPF